MNDTAAVEGEEEALLRVIRRFQDGRQSRSSIRCNSQRAEIDGGDRHWRYEEAVLDSVGVRRNSCTSDRKRRYVAICAEGHESCRAAASDSPCKALKDDRMSVKASERDLDHERPHPWATFGRDWSWFLRRR